MFFRRIVSIGLSALFLAASINIVSFAADTQEVPQSPELILTPEDVTEYNGVNVGEIIDYVTTGSWIKYTIDFGDGIYNKMGIDAAVGIDDPEQDNMFVTLDTPHPNGTPVASYYNKDLNVDGWDTYHHYEREITPIYGTHDLYIYFQNTATANLKNIRFSYDPDIVGNSSLLGTISGYEGTIDPVFSPQVDSYTLTVDSDAQFVNLYLPAADKKDAATYLNGVPYDSSQTQKIELTGNITKLTVKVVSQDGASENQYFITIQKQLSGELKDIYVAPDGDDTANTGTTPDSPLKSLHYALACAKEGSTVHIAEGKYIVDTLALKPASGVTVTGAGMGKTIIESHLTLPPTEFFSAWSGNGFLFVLDGVENVTLENMTVKGCIQDTSNKRNDPTNAHGGVFVSKAKNVLVSGMEFDWFNYSGVFMGDSVESQIADCKFWNSGLPDNSSCSGAIDLYNLTDCEIHGNYIREDRGGYGIKGFPVGFNYGNMKYSKLTRVKIYNNDINLRQTGGWMEEMGITNMGIELWRTSADEVEIFNNIIWECTSLIGDSAENVDTYAFRVYNNYFKSIPCQEGGSSYFIESSFNKSEVFNNYFEYGFGPIACFGEEHYDNKFYNNVFDKTEALYYFGDKDGINRYQIENNIFYLTDQHRLAVERLPFLGVNHNFPAYSLGKAVDVQMNQNIFYAEESVINNGEGAVLFKGDAGNFQNVTAQNNTFYNWNAEGENALEADPLINHNDFRLDPTSPAYSQGFESIDLSHVGLTEDFLYADENEEIIRTFLVTEAGDTDGQISMSIGESVQMNVLGRRYSGSVVQNLPANYSVEDVKGSQVLEISEDGLVTAANEGTAKVTSYIQTEKGELISSVYVQVAKDDVSVDKSKLQSLIQETESMELSLYTEESIEELHKVVSTAKTVLNDKDASQEEVDQIIFELQQAINLLTLKKADYSRINTVIEKLNAMNPDFYVDFSKVQEALDAVVWGLNITQQAEVDKMAHDIEDAILTLVLKSADYSRVDKAIAKANALNSDDYQDFTAVKAALDSVVRGKNIMQQAEVDAMANEIEFAIKSLKRKDTSSQSPEESLPQTNGGESQTPFTGDSRGLVVVLVLLILSGVGTLIMNRSEQIKHNKP